MAGRVNTARDKTYPNVGKKRRRIRIKQLTRANTARSGNNGAPLSNHMNQFPFPYGDSKPARHGHHRPFPVGVVRRVGAWRASGVLGAGRSNRGK